MEEDSNVPQKKAKPAPKVNKGGKKKKPPKGQRGSGGY